MGHTQPDMAGDERHDITAHHKGETIIAEGSHGFIAADERIIGPVGSTGTRRRGRGNEGSTTKSRFYRHNIRILANDLVLPAEDHRNRRTIDLSPERKAAQRR